MTTGDWFLVIAALAAAGTLASSIKIHHPPPLLIIPLFVISLITSELTWFMVAAQALVSLVFVASGALEDSSGVLALVLMLASWLGMWRLHKLSQQADSAFRLALESGLGADFNKQIPAGRTALLRRSIDRGEWLRPFSHRRPGVEHLADISYGDAGERNLLDIYRPRTTREGGFPVLLQIHGGGWYMGHKQEQALPLMYHLAQRGWLCVSINYRLSPAHSFPAHIIDVKKAIAWIRDNIADYGGNADFIAITGGSAGGHLSALAALSGNDPAYQPGFEQADTRVDAAVPVYGVYDFLDHSGLKHNVALRGFLQDKIMGCTAEQDPELWRQASPVLRVNADAPPFYVIHGQNDVMTAPEEAAIFVDKLRSVSGNAVAYAELPGAQHAFDVMHSIRTDYMANHVTAFLEWAYANRSARASP